MRLSVRETSRWRFAGTLVPSGPWESGTRGQGHTLTLAVWSSWRGGRGRAGRCARRRRPAYASDHRRVSPWRRGVRGPVSLHRKRRRGRSAGRQRRLNGPLDAYVSAHGAGRGPGRQPSNRSPPTGPRDDQSGHNHWLTHRRVKRNNQVCHHRSRGSLRGAEAPSGRAARAADHPAPAAGGSLLHPQLSAVSPVAAQQQVLGLYIRDYWRQASPPGEDRLHKPALARSGTLSSSSSSRPAARAALLIAIAVSATSSRFGPGSADSLSLAAAARVNRIRPYTTYAKRPKVSAGGEKSCPPAPPDTAGEHLFDYSIVRRRVQRTSFQADSRWGERPTRRCQDSDMAHPRCDEPLCEWGSSAFKRR